jgi:hypothetical protein
MYCTIDLQRGAWERGVAWIGSCGAVALQEDAVHVLVMVYISLSTLGSSDFGKILQIAILHVVLD